MLEIDSIPGKDILEISYNINKNKNILKNFWIKVLFMLRLEMP